MITTVVQRWRAGSPSWRPADERFDPRGFEAECLASDAPARAFVREHHYSHSYPPDRFRFGLRAPGGELVGVAVFSVPLQRAVLHPFPLDYDRALELGRFVLRDQVKGMAETWFLARCLEVIARGHDGLEGVVSFSDPLPRARATGDLVFRGHVGTIYQARSAVYLGRQRPHTIRLFADGTELSNRAISKLRGRERGWGYVVEMLVAAGAKSPARRADLAGWQRKWVARLTRAVRHPGKHKYAIPVRPRGQRACLPFRKASLPYPKAVDQVRA